jgi:hypothetical protein
MTSKNSGNAHGFGHYLTLTILPSLSLVIFGVKSKSPSRVLGLIILQSLYAFHLVLKIVLKFMYILLG